MISIKQKITIVAAVILLITVLVVLILLLKSIDNYKQPVSYAVSSYPVSLTNESLIATGTISDYNVEIKQDGDFYIGEYIQGDLKKEIYRWKSDLGYGIGGQSCNGIKYSPDKSHFIACVSTAVVADHQWVPLIFNSKGELVTDMANINKFPVSMLKDESLTKDNTNATYPVSQYLRSLDWVDNSTIELHIFDKNDKTVKIWLYNLGSDTLIAK